MKKIYFISLTLLLLQSAKATVRTVSNVSTPSAQYNKIKDAVNASSNGDTILIQGSPKEYDSLNIDNKRLIVIGPGWKPLRINPPLTANIPNCRISGMAASGTEIQGLNFSGTGSGVTIQTDAEINNLRFIRNHFANSWQIKYLSGTSYNGFLFEGNWFENTYIGSSSNSTTTLTISNWIVQNNVFYNSGIKGFLTVSNFLVNHNLFYNSVSFGAFSSGSTDRIVNLTIQNNIFCKAEPVSGTNNGAVNCTFRNNLTYNTSAVAPWTLNNNIDGGGNILNQNPQMTAQTQVNSGINNPLLNFTISAGPANNSGNDSKDMGLLYDNTGTLNWKNSRMSRLPYVYKVIINNPSVTPGATLNVSLEARKNN